MSVSDINSDPVAHKAIYGSTPLFEDGKDPEALRTIGEVGKALGIRPHVLRYWEEQFPALSPIKRSGSRRYYRPEDVALIAQIDHLVHREGYTLRGAEKVIADQVLQPNASISEAVPEIAAMSGDEEFFGKLAAIRAALAAGLAAA
ncbi:transcriptional regulator [Novosphingobium barchaimii LL02]|uniref:Transcriptional regulator n=1 Tax=Novosphingobium barchaimii LL02 TaxID=1114963 RepID=A0A0J7Y5R3_9SPHN|nr:MerR family transcriptional regulator [Novosphingobium barchaimii]KMS59231.1 transcriptional regulator [Novosphingobium barchaimii LL02]